MSVVRKHDYVLIFTEPRGGTSTERHFKASSRYPAFLCAKLTLGISGRLTPERFLDAGGIKLLLGDKQIYPPMQ